MLKDLYESGKLYGYITDYYSGGKGIVIADNEEDAKQKVNERFPRHWKEEGIEDIVDVIGFRSERLEFDNRNLICEEKYEMS